jgi:transcriptional regulator with XRE-family HTH domain
MQATFNSVSADNLREIRSDKSMTQSQVADILGIPKEQVSRIESGERKLSHAEKMVLDAALMGHPVPKIARD